MLKPWLEMCRRTGIGTAEGRFASTRPGNLDLARQHETQVMRKGMSSQSFVKPLEKVLKKSGGIQGSRRLGKVPERPGLDKAIRQVLCRGQQKNNAISPTFLHQRAVSSRLSILGATIVPRLPGFAANPAPMHSTLSARHVVTTHRAQGSHPTTWTRLCTGPVAILRTQGRRQRCVELQARLALMRFAVGLPHLISLFMHVVKKTSPGETIPVILRCRHGTWEHNRQYWTLQLGQLTQRSSWPSSFGGT